MADVAHVLNDLATEYGQSGIVFQPQFRTGEIERDGYGNLTGISNLSSSGINLFLSPHLPYELDHYGTGGASFGHTSAIGLDKAFGHTFGNPGHEMAHQLLGHTTHKSSPISNWFADAEVGSLRALQIYGMSIGAFRNGAQKLGGVLR